MKLRRRIKHLLTDEMVINSEESAVIYDLELV